MPHQDSVVYIDSEGAITPIPLSLIVKAKDNSTLLQQFITAVTLNATHGYQLYHDPLYFPTLKNSFTTYNDVVISYQKYAMGERIMTDYSYSVEIARMALSTALNGLSVLTESGPVNRCLLPLSLTNGNLDPVDDDIVQQAVITLSNEKLFFQTLNNRHLI